MPFDSTAGGFGSSRPAAQGMLLHGCAMNANENRLRVQKAIGKRISELRTHKGWTRPRLARACGLDKDIVLKIEQGRTNARLSTLVEITSKLRTTIADLFEGIG